MATHVVAGGAVRAHATTQIGNKLTREKEWEGSKPIPDHMIRLWQVV